MDFRMKRFDTTIQTLGCLGIIGNILDFQSSLAQGRCRTARTEEVDILRGQKGTKVNNSSLVRNGNESAGYGDDVGCGAFFDNDNRD